MLEIIQKKDTNLYMCMYTDVYQMFNIIKTYMHSIVLRPVKHGNVISVVIFFTCK